MPFTNTSQFLRPIFSKQFLFSCKHRGHHTLHFHGVLWFFPHAYPADYACLVTIWCHFADIQSLCGCRHRHMIINGLFRLLRYILWDTPHSCAVSSSMKALWVIAFYCPNDDRYFWRMYAFTAAMSKNNFRYHLIFLCKKCPYSWIRSSAGGKASAMAISVPWPKHVGWAEEESAQERT